jgi:hypothetical protein
MESGDDSNAESEASGLFSMVSLVGAPTYKQRRKKVALKQGMPGAPGELGPGLLFNLVKIPISWSHWCLHPYLGYPEEERGRYLHRGPQAGRFSQPSTDSSLSLDRHSAYDSHDEAYMSGPDAMAADLYRQHGGHVPHDALKKRHTLVDPMDPTGSWFGQSADANAQGFIQGDVGARGRSVDAAGLRAAYGAFDNGKANLAPRASRNDMLM